MTGWTTNNLEPPITGTVLGKIRSDHPTLTDAAFEALTPTPVDLTNATTVTANIRRLDWSVVSHPVVLGDQAAAPGSWTLSLVTGDLSLAGDYAIEVEVEWPGMRPQTFGGASFSVAQGIGKGV